MKIKAKEVKRRIGILTDPNPTFVSLVDHGANQTPFNSVKRDRPITSQPQSRKGQKTMPLKAGKGSARKAVVARLTFSKSLFATEDKVTKYLETKGYDSVGEVEDGDDVWIVRSTEDVSDLKLDKPRSTGTKDAGVTAFIAEVLGKADASEEDDADDGEDDNEDGDDTEASGDEDGEEETPPASKRARAKAVETPPAKKTQKTDDASDYDTVLDFPPTATGTKKFDWWAAYMSDEGSLTGVLADGIGYDGVPPGVDTLVQATHWTIGNILGDSDLTSAEKKAKLAQLGADLGDLTFGLFELFEGAQDNVEKSESAKKFVESFSASVDSAQAITLDSGNVTKADGKKPTAKADDSGNGDDADSETGTQSAEQPADIEALIAKALAPVVAGVSTLRNEVRTIGKKADAAASRQPSRKSLSDAADDLIDPATSKKTQETPEERDARLDARKRDIGGAFGYVPSARSGT